MAVPTPTTSFSTTCLVVSVPESSYTVHYTSGEVGIYPPTTYTAPTDIVRTETATIEASCFTLAPGQSIPSSVAFVGVSCETYYHPATTETWTYTSTPGQPFVVFDKTLDVYTGTTTRYVTETYTRPPFSGVYCTPLPDVRNPDTCDHVTPLTWASLVITFITVHLTWWLFDLPLLWKKKKKKKKTECESGEQKERAAAAVAPAPTTTPIANADDDRAGFHAFLYTVTWACLRVNAPGCAAFYSVAAGRDTGEFAAMYYLGVRRSKRDGAAPQFTAWKLATCVVADLLSIVAVAVTVYQACTLPEYAPRRFGDGLWAYPSLPTALIGLCLLAGRAWFPRTRLAAIGLVLMVVGVLVLVGVALALLLWRFDQPNNTWFVPVIFYGIMAFPVVVVARILVLFAIPLGGFGRVGGVSIAASEHYSGGQPYCKMPGAGFTATYVVLGVISGLLALQWFKLHHPALHNRSMGALTSPSASQDNAAAEIAQAGGAGFEAEKAR
ncbi:uncharacterized protein THITE_157579 [Thermothielavioides terrestris NRRL 8126]|uniref:Uncharacterized protein n=1 Tax=Thermothielavioides terrestris (strain ATCC 38088 / NRRL 8126) TaxID=578455 RepID=G2RCX6_THETT|nr:uncharacterized protein THITE_157579 [Thermothielavioides terrestris NRRL 8126]AEO69864.1 hypothetical protein THITE_157579 [Thermothielavioides terrestris NRRL 8126]